MRSYQNLIVGFLSLLLSTGILIPSALQFSHFTEHKHVNCDEHTKTHFHQFDFECKLFDFQHAPQILYIPEVYTFQVINLSEEQNFDHYLYLSDGQKLYFSLRAPPINS